MVTIRIRLGRRLVNVQRPDMFGQLLVVGYGMGTDSTALLVWLHRNGIRPDVITFADTGDEKPETYAYLATINTWLASVGFPLVTVVRMNSRDTSLAAQCLRNETLPSLAFGGHSCSLKWKVSAQETWTNSHEPAQVGWALGMKVLKLIGYDASPADCRRRGKAEASSAKSRLRYDYAYPLADAGITRDGCEELIRSAGLPLPGKSACYHCPASRPHEVTALAERHPALLAQALRMEAVAEAGRHGFKDGKDGKPSTRGLGRSWNWADYLRTCHPSMFARLAAEHDIGQEHHAEIERIRAARGIVGPQLPPGARCDTPASALPESA